MKRQRCHILQLGNLLPFSNSKIAFSIVHQEKIEVVNCQANVFAEADHFDAPAIASKKEALNTRYQQLQVINVAIHVFSSYAITVVFIVLMNALCIRGITKVN